MAKFRPAATETLADGMPAIGIPGFVPWQNKMPNYFFATITLKVQLRLFVTSAKAVSPARIPVSPSADFPPVDHDAIQIQLHAAPCDSARGLSRYRHRAGHFQPGPDAR